MTIAASGGQQLLALAAYNMGKARAAAPATGDDEAKARDAEALRKARDAVEAIKRAKADMRSQRKAAAAQKIERLKRELQALRMFGGGDPKAIARQAARIARELAGAVRDFRGASRLPGAGDPAATAAAADPGADASAQASAADAEAAQVQAQAQTQARTETPTQAEPLTGQDIIDALSAPLAELAKNQAEAAADKKVEREARLLHRQVKAVIEEQRRRAAAQGRDDGEFEGIERTVAWAGRVVAVGDTGFPVNLLT